MGIYTHFLAYYVANKKIVYIFSRKTFSLKIIVSMMGTSVMIPQCFFTDKCFPANRAHKVSLSQMDLLDVSIDFPFAGVLVIT